MKRLLLVLLVLSTFGASAQDFKVISDPSTCKKKLQTKSSSTKTITANFKERVYSSMFNTPKDGTGTLKYKAEDKIRWEKKSPESIIVLMNGGSVKIKQGGEVVNNAMNNKLVKKMQSFMMKLINHEFLSEKDFSIRYYQTKTEYKLVLTPKNRRLSSYISSIDLIFDISSLALKKMTIYETEDDYVVYSFSSMKFNSSISESTFNQF